MKFFKILTVSLLVVSCASLYGAAAPRVPKIFSDHGDSAAFTALAQETLALPDPRTATLGKAGSISWFETLTKWGEFINSKAVYATQAGRGKWKSVFLEGNADLAARIEAATQVFAKSGLDLFAKIVTDVRGVAPANWEEAADQAAAAYEAALKAAKEVKGVTGAVEEIKDKMAKAAAAA